ncbi:MAG: hypothetical protein OXG78_15440 [Chloroflexi bacterium]|nr:hypothetical protein [Chloroflexota bacterium]
MSILSVLVVFWITVPILGQGTAAATEPDSQGAEVSTSRTSLDLKNPFLQDDLELLVGNVQRPNGFAWHDGSLFTVCNGDWTIYKIDDRTGDTITFVFGTRDGNMLLIDETAAGFDILVPDPENGTVWKVDQSRSAPARFTTAVDAPWGIAKLNDARYLITDVRTSSLIEVSENGEVREVQSKLRSPTGIALHDQKVYFANGGSARRGIEYVEIDKDTGYSEVRPLVSGLQNTTNILMGSDDKLYFAYALGTRGVIGRIDPTMCLESGCSNSDVEVVVFSDIPAPLAITLSDDLRLFLHSRFRPEIYWLQLPTESA